MKVCVIGVFSGDLDEGYKNIAFNLSKELDEHLKVLKMDVNNVFSLNFWINLKKFNPDIIHYLTAPTIQSFFILKLAKIVCNNPKTIISSLHPHFINLLNNNFSKKIVSVMQPDLITNQCNFIDKKLHDIGINTKFLPNGVDLNRFKPEIKDRSLLRDKYDLPVEKFIILHVGHVRNERGVKILSNIQKEIDNCQTLIVASSYFKTDAKLFNQLVESGCIILNEYIENIEEIYALSDCYIFPTPKGNSILMPLSVMEAMSSNIPVLSTKFEGIVDTFQGKEGLFFFDDKTELYQKLELIMKKEFKINNRAKLINYSWSSIAMNLIEIYKEVLD